MVDPASQLPELTRIYVAKNISFLLEEKKTSPSLDHELEQYLESQGLTTPLEKQAYHFTCEMQDSLITAIRQGNKYHPVEVCYQQGSSALLIKMNSHLFTDYLRRIISNGHIAITDLKKGPFFNPGVISNYWDYVWLSDSITDRLTASGVCAFLEDIEIIKVKDSLVLRWLMKWVKGKPINNNKNVKWYETR